MIRNILSSLVTTLALFSASAQVHDLTTEHLTNPLGIDAANPRLSWQTSSPQSTWQIIVGTDSAAVAQGKGNAWTSARQTGGQQLAIYSGQLLKPFTKYFWLVSTTNTKGQLSKSAVATFETGMMSQGNWKGAWITDTRDIKRKPAAYFRKTFTAGAQTAGPQTSGAQTTSSQTTGHQITDTQTSGAHIKSARAYIAAAGLYELYINGKKVGDHVLDPMYTRFDRRNLYVTYDVTDLINQGPNALGVHLGNGWYNLQSTAVWYFDKATWRARPSFCMDLRITYDDGHTETISSNEDWKTAQSPVIFNSIYTAEHYDARKELPGWNTTNYNDSAWKGVEYTPTPSQNIVAEAMVPIKHEQRIPAVGVQKFSDTDYVFDLGRNIAGVSQIQLEGPRGTVIKLKHGERLYANGHVDQSNIDVHYRPTDDTDPFQVDIYTLKGGEAESFMARFGYKGFQYVEVTSSQPIQLDKNSLVGFFMHSDVKPAGTIETSDSVVNKIWWATNNSYLSNLFGYPTDCPQREKNGWTGDAQIAVETGLYNFDAITVYEKWLADLRDEQQPNGVLPSIVPTDGWGYEWGNGPDWTSAIAVIPWQVYLFYGDSKILKDSYENIKRYVDHIHQLYPSGLCSWGLGDWVPVKSKASVELTSTCYYYADVNILAKAAKLFNIQEDYKTYSQLAENIKTAFNKKYLNEGTGIYNTGIQTEQSVPLYWGLAPDNLRTKIAAVLAQRVLADGTKLDVGLLGTKAILNALSENGYANLAYKLASSRQLPSWGWWIVNGATTLYENWPIDAASDISRNHIMFGEIGAWFYKGIGGIFPDPAAPGFKHIILKPNVVEGLDSFTATHESPYGLIRSAWKKEGKKVIYTVTIPTGSTATLEIALPGRPLTKKELSAGTQTISFY